jgi:UDP-N-acetylglucosamine acyltransferase
VPLIHPTAMIDPAAELDASVSVGAYSLIGSQVKIAAGTQVGAHCVIEGRTTIGKNNRIFQFNSLGAVPQDKKYSGEPCELVIGNNNTVREFCTFNIGSPGGGAVTRIGNDNWIMAYVHIAHDCQLGNNIVMANNATLAGHVEIGDWTTVGGLCGVHQFVKIGAQAMVGFASAVTQDVPPFMLVDGNPLAVRGVNSVGLQRRGFSPARVSAAKQMHRLLYRNGLTLQDAIAQIAALSAQIPDAADDVTMMVNFLKAAERGIAR